MVSVSRRVIVRRRLLADHERHIPTELRTSYTCRDAADTAPLLSPTPNAEPWPATFAKYASRTPAAVTTYVSARRPTDNEAAALALPPTAIVLVRDTITADAARKPIDLTRSVWPAESTTVSHYQAAEDALDR